MMRNNKKTATNTPSQNAKSPSCLHIDLSSGNELKNNAGSNILGEGGSPVTAKTNNSNSINNTSTTAYANANKSSQRILSKKPIAPADNRNNKQQQYSNRASTCSLVKEESVIGKQHQSHV